jgi:hypothetical protein
MGSLAARAAANKATAASRVGSTPAYKGESFAR